MSNYLSYNIILMVKVIYSIKAIELFYATSKINLLMNFYIKRCFNNQLSRNHPFDMTKISSAIESISQMKE